jgi:hypothetical protein
MDEIKDYHMILAKEMNALIELQRRFGERTTCGFAAAPPTAAAAVGGM